MLKLTTSEFVELMFACDDAIKKEKELINKYQDVVPWRTERHKRSLRELESAREKIYQAMKGV